MVEINNRCMQSLSYFAFYFQNWCIFLSFMQSILLTCLGTGLCLQSKPTWQQTCFPIHKSSPISAWILVQKVGNEIKITAEKHGEWFEKKSSAECKIIRKINCTKVKVLKINSPVPLSSNSGHVFFSSVMQAFPLWRSAKGFQVEN